MFDKEMKRAGEELDTELVKGSKTKVEGSSKRAGKELESDNSKKKKIDEHVEAEGDDDQEEAEMKTHMEININKEDLETLWKLVKAKHGNTRPEEAYESSAFCEISKHSYLYAGRENVPSYTCNNHKDAQQEASN
ncbi:hypothetical protein Tco_1447487 [Tanacetum coccineum]